MDQSSNIPSLAFVINLCSGGSLEPNDNRIRHLAHLFNGHRLPATWAVDNVERAKLLDDSQFARSNNELALVISSEEDISTRPFATRLRSQVSALNRMTSTAISLVVGNPSTLRGQASVLSEQGIGAILVNMSDPQVLPTRQPSAPRPMGCSLWQLAPTVTLPLPRRLWRLLPARHYSVKQLLSTGKSIGTTLVVIRAEELGRKSARSLQSFEKLLREVSWAASHSLLSVVNTSEVVAELADQRRVKPQRSILRAAA